MSLFHQLRTRADPIRILLIGCGKFALMFASQAHRTPNLDIVAIADLMPARVRQSLIDVGYDDDDICAITVGDDSLHMIRTVDADIMIEATGDPIAGAAHADAAIDAGKHVVMVNVEADVLCGVALARKARAAGLVYSMAYGDQPALIEEMVDWARACGFTVCAAGKGTKYLPAYHASTPKTVWQHYGLSAEHAAASGMNAKMFNSFLDGTKSAIEMAALANATGLSVSEDGLRFPPAGTHELATVLRPKVDGGILSETGEVEVVSSLRRDGDPVSNDLRWGVYVVIMAPSAYVRRCFSDYGLSIDSTGRFAALWRPAHLIGLELGISVIKASLLSQPTGSSRSWIGDVCAVTKSDLPAGTELDGEGGSSVWGRLVPAKRAADEGLLPIGLASGVRLTRSVSAGEIVRESDIDSSALFRSTASALRSTMRPGEPD